MLKKLANGSLLFLWFVILIEQVTLIGSISSFPDFCAVRTVFFMIAVLYGIPSITSLLNLLEDSKSFFQKPFKLGSCDSSVFSSSNLVWSL